MTTDSTPATDTQSTPHLTLETTALPSHATSSWVRYVIPAVLSTLLTLIVLAPVAYVISRNINHHINHSMPPRLVTVDLQALVDENQKHILEVMGKDGEITHEQRVLAQKLTMDFAKKLSDSLDALGQACHCIIINKAALLGGESADYTDQVRDQVRARIQQ